MKKLLFVINLLFVIPSFAQVERIQSTRFDRGQVMRIYLAPGLGSLVLFPCALVEVFVGRGEDLKAQISPSDKKTLFLNLKLNSSLPTNMIAKCEPERNVFVFDVIPSKSQHQDLVEIRNTFGRPSMTGLKATEVSKNDQVKGRLVLKSPVLIEKGGSK
ncbi:MAG: hypothetical protein KUL82_14340 [Bdellovibrio sp.]|nr:hypothetical protein [Bdellovibrio sp.]